MPGAAAARRYARALFGLAVEENRLDPVRREITALAELLEESPELRNVIYRPLHPLKERQAALEAVMARLQAGPTVRRFCAFLLQQRRMHEFPEVRVELERLANEAAGRVEAEITSAGPLGDAQLERLRGALAARTERDVQLKVAVDPTLLGGVVAKVGDLVFDGSLRTQLAQLRANLMKGR
jgi:F-type H+-transporting ATPase subunit delta